MSAAVHLQRWLRGTPDNTSSLCWPQPLQVALLQTRQVVRVHICDPPDRVPTGVEPWNQYTLGGMHTSISPRRIHMVVAAALAALTLAACGGGTAVTTVDAATFAKQVQAPGVTVIDVRTPAEFASGHIAGAVNIDEEGDFAAGIAHLDKSKTYAVYCHSGRRSGLATTAMADAGFTSIYNLDGGLMAWQQAGGPLTTS